MYFYIMMKAIIIDDEYSARKTLLALVERYCPNVSIIEMCEDAASGYLAINKHQPDLVFLDVDMPKESGFDLLEKYRDPKFDVVFTTGHDKYAIQAIKSSALDFLLKPVDIDELKALSLKLENKIHSEDSLSMQFGTLLENLKTDKKKKIAIPDMDGVRFVKIDEIIRCEAAGNYTKVILDSKESLLASKSLREFEDLFTENNFIRIHQSHLVSLEKIIKYVKNEGSYVIMTDGEKVDVSRRKKNILDEQISSLL